MLNESVALVIELEDYRATILPFPSRLLKKLLLAPREGTRPT